MGDPGALTTSRQSYPDAWHETGPHLWRPVSCVEVTAAPPGTLAPGTTACIDISSGLPVLLQADEQHRVLVDELAPPGWEPVPPG